MDTATLDDVLLGVSAGEPVRKLLAEKGVNPREFYALLASDEPVAKRYARAKGDAIEAMADEIVAIADESGQDVIKDGDGNERINGEFVQRSRLRVDTRKWLLSKLAPKKYGDKLDVEHSGNVTVALSDTDARL